MPQPDIADIYEAIGELVVQFQLAEDTYRQIGWHLVDPEKKQWPPMKFRRESNKDLIDKVTDLFLDLTNNYNFPNGTEKAAEATELRVRFHALRAYRNRILHSTYFEVKSGAQVLAVVRSNPSIRVDTETAELIYDEENVSPDSIRSEVGKYVADIFKLHFLKVQLIHWYPFNRYAREA